MCLQSTCQLFTGINSNTYQQRFSGVHRQWVFVTQEFSNEVVPANPCGVTESRREEAELRKNLLSMMCALPASMTETLQVPQLVHKEREASLLHLHDDNQLPSFTSAPLLLLSSHESIQPPSLYFLSQAIS